jgi:signal transduction histidine kinase
VTRAVALSYRREHDSLRRAQRALEQRDEVLGIVAHDLRSPIAAIAMKAEIIARSTAEEHTRARASSLRKVATRMETLIRGLLDAAAIDMGGFTVERGPVLVSEIVDEILETHGAVAAEKGVRVQVATAEPGLRVLADRDRIIQVVGNLVANAVKFTPAGGSVELQVARRGEQVEVAVSDTGPGLVPEHVPHLFERLWKSDRGGTKGTGLGLYIARGVVEAHGGRITAENRPGGGARFAFTLSGVTGPREPAIGASYRPLPTTP